MINISEYEIKIINETKWLNIYHHNARTLFSSNKALATMQVFYINETDRFSVIGYIDDNFKINGLYNFLFHFPDDYPDDFFYFNQSTHPLTSTTVQDFHYIFDNKKYFPNPNSRNMLNGLAISSESGAVLDGNVELDQWWYSIGTSSSFSIAGRIPGLRILRQ